MAFKITTEDDRLVVTESGVVVVTEDYAPPISGQGFGTPRSLRLLIDNGDGPVDYSQYVLPSTLQITDAINVPTTFTFTLVPRDGTFVVPKQMAYVQVYSPRFNKHLCTGFVINTPTALFLGMSRFAVATQGQVYQYQIQCTSDEYLLNLKAKPFIPAYVNQGTGQILANLAQTLAPEFFDVTSFVASGDIVPYFEYDPQQNWSDLAKQFADQSRYRYKVINKTVYFQPYGDAPLGVTYDETSGEASFAYQGLQQQVQTLPLVNDVIVVGGTEPQNNWDDYFIGDGVTGTFSLHHAVFEGDTSLLLQDDWTEQTISTQNWFLWDPQNDIQLVQATSGYGGAGALNCLGGIGIGQTYLMGQNGIEMGGQIYLQHGEIGFDDNCNGLIGCLHTVGPNGQPPVLGNCLVGFGVTGAPTVTIDVTASGCAGLLITPILNGVPIAPPMVKTQHNHSYVFTMLVNAQQWSRWNQTYRTISGSPFGGNPKGATGTITWMIQDIDQGNAWFPTLYTFTAENVTLPPFAWYVLLNSAGMILHMNYTLIALPPQGTLTIRSLFNECVVNTSGANVTWVSGSQFQGLQPGNFLVIGGVQYTIATATSSTALVLASSAGTQTGVSATFQAVPGELPVLPSNLGPENSYPLGNGLANQAATIALTGQVDSLEFYANALAYANTIPAVGARIRMQSWVAGAAVGRVQDPNSITAQAAIVGDDGVRSAILVNQSPQPRTSEECELAASAAVSDRVLTRFQGTYTFLDFFLDVRAQKSIVAQLNDYPRTGRYLYCNSPNRAMNQQKLLVTQVQMNVVELREEVIQFQVSFGPDLYLERVLAPFMERTTQVLLPNDLATQPIPQTLAQVGLFYLPDPINAKVTNITGTNITVDMGETPAENIEIRNSDFGWGSKQGQIAVMNTQVFNLPRVAYEQIWYLRYTNSAGQTSRFSKVLRVVYPLTPSTPSGSVDASNPLTPIITLSQPGDVRNVYGVEIRASDNVTVLVQKPVLTQNDLVNNVNLTQNPNLVFHCYFFNLMWEYSPVFVPPIVFFRSSHTSYRPLSNPLTGHDAGSSATINIAGFTMASGGTDATVFAGSITSLAYNTLYYIYYDDPTFVGNAVAFHATTTKEVALQGDSRYFVGSITTPRAGAIDTKGNGDGGSGAQYGMVSVLSMSLADDTGTVGNGNVANPDSAIDGDLVTYAALTATADGVNTNGVNLSLSGPPGFNQKFSNAVLKIAYTIPTNTLSGPDPVGVISATVAGVSFNFVNIDPGVTVPTVTVFTTNLGIINLAQVAAVIVVLISTSYVASGTIEVDVLEAWIEATG